MAWTSISLWMEQLEGSIHPRASLTTSISADVVIIGAGYTGLWTAYYLKKQSPELEIVVLEGNIAGYGASGRNGGWLIGEMAGQDKLLSTVSKNDRQQAHQLLHGIPAEVARVIELENIDCDFKMGGMLCVAARYPEQSTRLKQSYRELSALGYSKNDQQWLEGSALSERIKINSATGAIYSPHCASVHPAKLVRGLADTVERLGVKIYEQSMVTQWQPGEVQTSTGKVTAKWVVLALEADSRSIKTFPSKLSSKFSARFSKFNLPVQSLIIATEPLCEEQWASIGVSQGEVFSDNSRQVTYGNRTKDNRLVFGARGSYRFGGKLRTEFTLTSEEIAMRKKILVELFPQLESVAITHAWGGNLAMGRNFHPYMGIDESDQLVFAGGYGGEGVGASNLSGRTLTDLILNRNTTNTLMPWVFRNGDITKINTWESEPIPWLGYRMITETFDKEEKILANLKSAKWKRKLISTAADYCSVIVG